MREIKFRGKRIDTKEWVYGFYAKTVTSEEINCVADCRKHDIIIDEHGTFYYVIPETVGQYTGFKDSNGKEIYENDILEKDLYWSIRIEYDEGSFMVRDLDKVRYANLCLNWYIGGFDLNGWEVIGDIHSNQELLEGN